MPVYVSSPPSKLGWLFSKLCTANKTSRLKCFAALCCIEVHGQEAHACVCASVCVYVFMSVSVCMHACVVQCASCHICGSKPPLCLHTMCCWLVPPDHTTVRPICIFTLLWCDLATDRPLFSCHYLSGSYHLYLARLILQHHAAV